MKWKYNSFYLFSQRGERERIKVPLTTDFLCSTVIGEIKFTIFIEEREKMSQKRKEITNYRQIERLRYIHESLSSGSYPTTQKLARDLEASTATISRDIEFLRDRYHAPCEYDPERKGFFYTEPDFQLDLFTPINREVRRKIATDKQSFAEYMNYPLKLLDKLELITDIDYPNQTELQANNNEADYYYDLLCNNIENQIQEYVYDIIFRPSPRIDQNNVEDQQYRYNR